MTEVRRSERARKSATTLYDEARIHLLKSAQSNKVSKPRKIESDESSANNSADEDEGMVDSSDESSQESMDEKYKHTSRTLKAKSSAVSKTIVAAKATNKNVKKQSTPMESKISSTESTPEALPSRKRKIAPASNVPLRKKSGNAKNVYTALQSLFDHIIEEEENVNNSLLAALLKAHSPVDNSNVMQDYSSYIHETNLSSSTTKYTPQLYAIARKVVQSHNEDPNAAQVQLVNLIFRSLGGTVDANIRPDVCLDDLNRPQWDKIMKKLVHEMECTPFQHVLISADPLGVEHSGSKEVHEDCGMDEKQPSIAVREFRKIYEEFWYVLGVVALTEGNMSAKHHDLSPGEEQHEYDANSDPAGSKKRRKSLKDRTSTSNSSWTYRFDADLVGEIMNRLLFFTDNHYTDVRAASTLAIVQLGLAVVDRTVLLVEKLNAMNRQLTSATTGRSSTGPKADSIRNLIDSLKRNRKDLDEILTKNVVDSLIVQCFRDTSPFIRVYALDFMSRLIMQRPDLFFHDRYLKYFGWMLSDKSSLVRISSLNGLLSPFYAVENSKSGNRVVDIDLSKLESLMTKFVNRLADCTVDVSAKVQEKAMTLLLFLLRKGFLDELEDDMLWNQINLRAISPDASPKVRLDALYFIMEQLEAFDDGVDDDSGNRVQTNKRIGTDNERTIVRRLDAIASWIANALTDGPIPLEKIDVSRVDLIVHSLRNMPEHKAIVTKWPVLLSAIREDSIAMTVHGTTAGDRVDAAKQRVLVEMFVSSIMAEVNGDCMKETVNMVKKKNASKSKVPSLLDESLCLYIIQSLPELLAKFKSDLHILESLVTLPQYLSSTVLSVSQYKANFDSLLKHLSDIFLHSSDEVVLHKIAKSLSHLRQSQYSHAADVDAFICKMVDELYDRILPFLSNQSSRNSAQEKESQSSSEPLNRSGRRSSRNSKQDKERMPPLTPTQSQADLECSFSVNLLRFRILSQQVDISFCFDHSRIKDVNSIEEFSNMLCDSLIRRLNERSLGDDQHVHDRSAWGNCSEECHAYATIVIDEGLHVLMTILAWNVLSVMKNMGLVLENEIDDVDSIRRDDLSGEDVTDHFTLRLRNRLISLVVMCFDHFSSGDDEDSVSKCQIHWSHSVQESAGLIASDLRMLFPKEWSEAASPLLRSLSITDDAHLIAGYVRYLRSKQDEMLSLGPMNNDRDQMTATLLEPIARSLAINWKLGNRREASVVLAHYVDEGPMTSSLVESLMRYMKMVDPVRLLEAQMASLRQSYEDWMENEPEDREDLRPNEKEKAVEQHNQQFEGLMELASKFSISIGIRKPKDLQSLHPAILGFVREGMRYAFSNTDDDGEEVYVAGSRLSFLKLLTKYTMWMTKNKHSKQILERDLALRTKDLQSHAEYDEVRSDDMSALNTFREFFGFKPLDRTKAALDEHEVDGDSSVNKAVTPEPSSLFLQQRNRVGGKKGGSLGTTSLRSRISSNPSTLSPLYEEDRMIEDDDESGSDDDSSYDKVGRKVSKEMDDTQTTFDGLAMMSPDGSE